MIFGIWWFRSYCDAQPVIRELRDFITKFFTKTILKNTKKEFIGIAIEYYYDLKMTNMRFLLLVVIGP